MQLELSVQLMSFLACVGFLTGAAAITDLRIKKIPNKLTLPFFVAGLLYQGLFHGLGEGVGRPGLLDAAAAFAFGFGTLWVLWMIGGGGGGDVKLLGALSVWIGFKQTCWVLGLSTFFVICAAVGAIVAGMFAQGFTRSKTSVRETGATPIGESSSAEVLAERRQRRIMGYAPPVALATWLVVLWKLPKFPEF